MIFTPRKNVYFPQPKWGFPKFQRGIICATPIFGEVGPAFDETINVGQTTYCTAGTSSFWQTYGYNVGNYDFENEPAYGSITGTTYTDGSSTSRTVASVAVSEASAGVCSSSDELHLSLQGTSIPNTNNTFVEMKYESNAGSLITYTRTSATYTASLNGGTHWTWFSATSAPTSGTARVIQIFI